MRVRYYGGEEALCVPTVLLITAREEANINQDEGAVLDRY